MSRTALLACCVICMIAVIVAVDVAWFRGHFWLRLMMNIGIVLVSAALVLRFVRGAGR